MQNHQPALRAPSRRHTIERFMPAPVETVFEAWISPVQLMSWWAAGGYSPIWCEVDPRSGGNWRVLLVDHAGHETWAVGNYQELQPPSRLVTTISWHGDMKGGERSLIQVDLEAVAGGTQLKFTSERLDPTAQLRAEPQYCLGC